MHTYRTQQGDTWDLIAYRTMETTRYTNLVMKANRAFLEYYVFPAGVELTIPDTPRPVDPTAPPWKKVDA